jgi:Flp pilus assembly protein TadD
VADRVGQGEKNSAPNSAGIADAAGTRNAAASFNQADLSPSLEELAELERAGSFTRGMALVESGLRENAGDYAGAVAAAYKELAWAYAGGFIEKAAVEQGLENVAALGENGSAGAVQTAEGILAFSRGQWDEAERILRDGFDELEEPDGFVRWMILVCALEQNRNNRQAGAAYRTVRARYAQFPEYWYRGPGRFPEPLPRNTPSAVSALLRKGPLPENVGISWPHSRVSAARTVLF